MTDVNPAATSPAALNNGFQGQAGNRLNEPDGNERPGPPGAASQAATQAQEGNLNPPVSTVNVSEEAQARLAAENRPNTPPPSTQPETSARDNTPAARLAQQFNDILGDAEPTSGTAAVVSANAQTGGEAREAAPGEARAEPALQRPDTEVSQREERAQPTPTDPGRRDNGTDLTG